MTLSSDTVVSLWRDFEHLKTYRRTWESHWQEVADLILPHKGGFTHTSSPGQRKQHAVYNGLPQWALEQFAAGLHGALTGGDRPWFTLRFVNPHLQTYQQGQEWLQQVSRLLLSILHSPRAGFFSSSFDTWLDLGAFGTAVVYTEQGDAQSPLRFFNRPLFECYIRENHAEDVDTVFRYFSLSLRRVVDTWPNARDIYTVSSQIATNPEHEVSILHAVYPNTQRQGYQSVYLLDQSVLEVREYNDFPYLVARWVRGNGEVYGRSPGMVALPDIRMLYKMEETVLRAAQLLVNPPLRISDGFQLPFRFAPGALIPAKPGHSIEPLYTGNQINIGRAEVEHKKHDILRAFYVELFRLSENPQMTATEVLYRREERLRLLGPVVGRLQREFLGKLIERVFAIVERLDLLPQAPEELQSQLIEVEYVSPLAQAQRMTELQKIQAVLSLAGQLTQWDAGVVEVIDSVQTLRHGVDMLGAPSDVLYTEEELLRKRQLRQQQQQQQQQLDALQQGADVLQKGGSGIAHMLKGVQGRS